MEYWQQLLILILSPASILVLVGFFMKSYFLSSLQKDIESYKKDLELKYFEFLNKTSLINQKRVDVIGELYGKLNLTYSHILDLTSTWQINSPPLKTKKEIMVNIFNDTELFFYKNCIYLNENLSNKTKSLLNEIKRCYQSFSFEQNSEHYKPSRTGIWEESFNKVKNEVGPVLEELEKEFRLLVENKI